ncbi:MAG TPA: toll/interleukin-1 receptor domain-containing protein [Thermoanaerobaculia bacterium]|nr:toll/interleukin-1 receptor domain-containing protein [Thermoanaerobaculia bacterium]
MGLHLGIDTFFKSGGLPESLLRLANLPEEFITYATSLAGHPIEFYSCFLSYSSQDDAFVRRLHADLQQRKIKTWFAPEDLKIGDRFRSRIDESIRIHDKLVLVLSAHSIDSPWVRREVEAALDREDRENKDVLFPITLDDAVFESGADWAAEVRRRHIGKFHNWKSHDDYSVALDRLVRDLKKEGPIVMR